MAKLTILVFPDPRLRKTASPVDVVDDALRGLIDDMFETMYAAPGIGLAATQVDVHRRLLVADVSANSDEPHALINPVILEKDGVTVSEEGCLSVPGYYEEVERAEHIRVRYQDRSAAEVETEMEGTLAICVQHEIDHLDGTGAPGGGGVPHGHRRLPRGMAGRQDHVRHLAQRTCAR